MYYKNIMSAMSIVWGIGNMYNVSEPESVSVVRNNRRDVGYDWAQLVRLLLSGLLYQPVMMIMMMTGVGQSS
jgi:hypothetical protein